MSVLRRYKLGCLIAAMVASPLVFAGIALYLRGEPYRAAARALPAEHAAATAEHISLSPADLERQPPVPDEENAAPLYTQLVIPPTKEQSAIAAVAAGKASLAERRAAPKFVAAEAQQIRLAEQAAALPHCDFHRNWRQGLSLQLPEYAAMRNMARLLAAKAMIESDGGHPEAALRTIRIGAAMARHLGEEPIIIAMLVRIAIEAIMARPLIQVIERYSNRPEVLRQAAAIERDFGDLPDIRAGTASEPALASIISDSYANSDDTIEHAISRAMTGVSASTMARASEMRTVRYWRRIYKALGTCANDPMARYRAIKAVDHAEDAAMTASNGQASPTYELVWSFRVETFQIAAKIVEMEARRRLRRTLVAVLHHRARTGRLPDSLGELKPAAPLDPFDAMPLHYRRERDGFVLYSVGQNLKDDGGSEKKASSSDPPPDIVIRMR